MSCLQACRLHTVCVAESAEVTLSSHQAAAVSGELGAWPVLGGGATLLCRPSLPQEGSNVAHIVGRLKGAMKKMVAQRQLHTTPMQRHDPLQERRNKHRAPSLTAEEARLSDFAF